MVGRLKCVELEGCVSMESERMVTNYSLWQRKRASYTRSYGANDNQCEYIKPCQTQPFAKSWSEVNRWWFFPASALKNDFNTKCFLDGFPGQKAEARHRGQSCLILN